MTLTIASGDNLSNRAETLGSQSELHFYEEDVYFSERFVEILDPTVGTDTSGYRRLGLIP